MKRDSFLRFLLASLALTLTSHLYSAEVATCYFQSNEDLARNAISLIQSELSNRSGKIYSVVARCNVTDNQAKSIDLKFYFSDYHKSPEKICQNFHAKDTSINKIVEVVYNPKKDKENVTFFERKPSSKRRCSKPQLMSIND